MPSPFPGMDPYIESWLWEDFHARLISAIYDRLNPALPKRYIASTELYVRRMEPTETGVLWLGSPDLHVAEHEPALPGSGVATVVPPIRSRLPARAFVQKQRYLKVIDAEERRVVTVIEVLSPSNKRRGSDGEHYRLKREEYIESNLNLVEIDLLRSGLRPPLGEPEPLISDYYILVQRNSTKDFLDIWPVSIREALPFVHVPLDPDVPDVVFDLRACIDHVYDFGRYHEQLDYTKPPKPPLREPDVLWARELLESFTPRT